MSSRCSRQVRPIPALQQQNFSSVAHAYILQYTPTANQAKSLFAHGQYTHSLATKVMTNGRRYNAHNKIYRIASRFWRDDGDDDDDDGRQKYALSE